MSYEVWSQEQLQKFAEDNWARVPDDKRKACVEHLREILPQDLTDYVKQSFTDLHSWFHFSEGMAIRNALREVMKDDELPKVKYPGGGDYEYSNWDDFYMAALRQAVAPKEGEA
jgi:hypothetical protein